MAEAISQRAIAFDCIKRYARGLIKHFWRGQSEYNHDAAMAWAWLDTRTNCFVSNATAAALRLFQPRQHYKSTNGLLGTFSRSERREIVQAVRRDGYYIFPQLMPAHIVDGIEKFVRTTPGEVYPVPANGAKDWIFDRESPVAPVYWYWIQNLPEVQAMMADENFTAIATEYLRVDPVMPLVQSWASVPFGEGPSADNAQMYHTDIANMRMFKFFVYLTDVGHDNGPHCIIRGSHRTRDTRGAALRLRGGGTRIPDNDIYAAFGRDREVEITGPRGTIFAADPREFHKGKHPAKGERIMMQLYYSNSSFGLNQVKKRVDNPTPEYRAAAKRWPRLVHYYPPAQ